MTGVKLEKVSDTDMYLFIKKGLRGGISDIAKRHSKANNKYTKNYDPTKPPKYVLHLDMNNLYSLEISGYLPYGGFQWLKNVGNSGKLHNDYPVAPDKLAMPYDMLSDYCKKLQTNME